MLQGNKQQLTTIQTAIFIISIILGTGVLTLPRTVTEKTQTPDGWISIILAGAIFLVFGRLIILLNRYYPNLTFFEYAPIIFGKWLGNLVNFIIITEILLTAGYQLRGMSEVTQIHLLPTTPVNFKILVMIFVAIYLMNGGIISVARLFEILLPICLVFFSLVFLLSFRVFELQNIRPVMGLGIEPILKGIPGSLLSFTGFEFLLFLNAYMEQKNKCWKAMAVSILFSSLFYLFVYIAVIGGLGTDNVMTLTFPTIDLVRSIEVTAILFERYESFLLAVWIMQIFTTYVSMHYIASLGLSQITGKNIRTFIYGLAPVVVFIANAPAGVNEEFLLGNIYSYTVLFIVAIIVPLALGIAWLRNRLSPSWKK